MTRTLAILLACLLYSSYAIAEGRGLDEFLHNLNVQAKANPEGFSATLSSQFRVSGTEVRSRSRRRARSRGRIHGLSAWANVAAADRRGHARLPEPREEGMGRDRPRSSASSRDQRSSTRSNGATSASAPRPPRTATTTSAATDAARESTAASRVR